MNSVITQQPLHVSGQQLSERTRWYGPNLITFFTTTPETGGAFTLIKCVLRKGFEPPLHVHSKEDESYIVMEGEVQYEAGEQIFHAKAGDYVHLPKQVPHTFKLISDTATILLLITPGGFEEMFMKFSRPALSMSLPPLSTEKPGKEFFESMKKVNEELGVTMFPAL